MAACAAEGFRLSLAASLLELDEAASLDALHELSSRSLVEEIDRDFRPYRPHTLVREGANGDRFRKQHAQAVKQQFQNWETNWRQCEQDLPDFQAALTWALVNREELGSSSVEDLAYYGFKLNRRIGYPAEALEICRRMQDSAEARADKWCLQAWLGNQALILQAWGGWRKPSRCLRRQKPSTWNSATKTGYSAPTAARP